MRAWSFLSLKHRPGSKDGLRLHHVHAVCVGSRRKGKLINICVGTQARTMS